MALRITNTKSMMDNRSVVGQERIAVNVKSPLFVELTRIAQLGIDATEKYQRDTNYATLSNDIITGFASVIYTAMNVPINNAIFKHLGIKLRKFIVPDDRGAAYPNAYCATMYRSVLLNSSDTKKIFNLHGVISYGGVGGDAEWYDRIVNSAQGKVDLVNGRFDPSINNAFSWDIAIHPGMFMCGRVHVDPSENLDSVYTRVAFTAEELAAIILHELGHGFYMVADVVDSVKKNDTLADVYRQSMKSALNKKGVTIDKDIPKSKSVGIITLINILSERALHLLADTGSILALRNIAATFKIKSIDDLITNLSVLKKPGFIKAVAWLVFFFVIAPKLIRWACSGDHITEAIANITGTMRKRGETVLSSRQGQRVEEIADSFATRHGAGAALMIGISKLYPHLQKKNSMADTARQITSITGIISMMSSYVNLTAEIEPARAANSYPETINRFYLILQEQTRVLKTMTRTPDTEDVMDQMVHAMRTMHVLMDEINKDPKFIQMKSVAKLFGDENTRGTIIGGLLTGNLTEDYRKMQDALDEMSANKSYYNAEDFITE